MYNILLTQYSGTFIGPVARLLGYLMNFIFIAMDKVLHTQNIGLAIIIFTILIYVILFPLTLRQQKFAKMSQKMNPEIQAVQKKYAGKKDQASMVAMNEETQAIYAKYGIHPTGSCLQLVIQMPILLGLYRVIYNVPAYVTNIKGTFTELVNGIMATDGYKDVIQTLHDSERMTTVSLDFTDATTTSNSLIDVLYKLTSGGWNELKSSFSGLGDIIETTHAQVATYNNFLGLDIATSPIKLIQDNFSAGNYLLVILAVCIPVASFITQRINIKMMPQQTQQQTGDPQKDAMASSMKTMNVLMPLMSVYMCTILPVGLGIYWITGPIVRCIQNFFINKHLDNMDLEAEMEKNLEKAKIKQEKRNEKLGVYANQISSAATMSTKNISADDKKAKIEEAYNTADRAKKGTLTSKANMVKDFNQRNSK